MEFKYVAMDQHGREVEGIVKGDSEAQALRVVKEMGLFPTRVTNTSHVRVERAPREVVSRKDCGRPSIPFFKCVSRREKAGMFYNLAGTCDAGIPLLKALRVLQRAEKNKTLKVVYYNMAEMIESGSTFAEALSQYPKVFDEVEINMVKAGECAGALHPCLHRLAEYIEGEGRIKSGVRWAVLSALGAGASAVATLALAAMAFAPSIPVVPIAVTVVAFASALIAVLYVASRIFPFAFDRVKLLVPLFGRLSIGRDVAAFCRLLGVMLVGGVPILQALNIAKVGCRNRVFAKLAESIHDSVKEGETIVLPVSDSKIFPAVATTMIQVGEETGALPEMLVKIAEMNEHDVERDVKALNTFSVATAVLSVLAIAIILIVRLS